MTREQKLEAALREVRSYAERCIDGIEVRNIIDEALTTPPTSYTVKVADDCRGPPRYLTDERASEWNEAIEAVEKSFSGYGGGDVVPIYDVITSIRALKRKEQP